MLIMMFAGSLASGAGVYNVLWTGALVTGIGWGLVETVTNPMVASLYPDDKAGKLNAVHAWWPGGLVIGGLLGVAISRFGMGWQANLAVVFIPAGFLVVLCASLKFPPTERVAAGVSAKDMFKELLNPLFFILFASIFLTAASELAPGQWVDLALSRTVHMPGILLLVYVSGLMFLMRHFAGPLVERISPVGVLWFSCLGAALGLIGLSIANSPVTALLAATVWGTGVCYIWPTILATASERFPRGGALLMGLMGNGRHAFHPIRAAHHGVHLRFKKGGSRWRACCIQSSASRAGIGSYSWNCRSGILPRRGRPARFSIDCVLPASGCMTAPGEAIKRKKSPNQVEPYPGSDVLIRTDHAASSTCKCLHLKYFSTLPRSKTVPKLAT
jgi:MFS family permease